MTSSTLFITKSTFSYQKAQKQKLLKNMQNEWWQDQFCVTRIYLANCEFSFPNWLIKLSKRKLWNFGICGSLPALHAFCRVDLLNPTHNVNELLIDYTRSGYKANKVNRSVRQRRFFKLVLYNKHNTTFIVTVVAATVLHHY